ncbi:hypothetical protein VM636_07220 [Streptomyces sp. SCSIO 75703]|uniref:hypothetical protein n=1 Tax=Streptomyces sp. SCSIO 75703 TaxID=3112165 RepID=UPI0030CB4E89
MANLADEYGTDVEIYIKALTTTIRTDTPTGAPAGLHDLLEQLGLERHEYPTGEPLYLWHTVPDHLGAEEQKRLANRAIPALLLAGYTVNCDPEVFDEALYQQAVHRLRARGPPCPAATGARQFPSRPRTGPPHPVSPGGPGTAPGPPTSPPPNSTEKPVAERTPAPISHRLKPRLATALFRRYLRACITAGPDRASPLAGARPDAVPTEAQRVGQRHHH